MTPSTHQLGLKNNRLLTVTGRVGGVACAVLALYDDEAKSSSNTCRGAVKLVAELSMPSAVEVTD